MSSYNPKQAGSDMSARLKLNAAKRALLATMSNGTADPNDIDSGITIVDRPQEDVVKLNAAKASLRETLSGRTPIVDPPITESTVDYRLPSGVRIASEITPGAILRLNAAKRELDGTLAGLTDATRIAFEKDRLIKTMQQGGGGIRNQTEDSGRTNLQPGEVAYSGGWSITGRGSTVTLDTIAAEERKKAAEPSPSPAVRSGQSNLAPGSDVEGKKKGGDSSPTDTQKEPEFSHEKVKADLVTWATGEGGKVDRRKAKSVFLVQNGSGSSANDYEIPLATIGEDGEPQYHPKLLDDAYDHASGKFNNIANRALQNRVIRLKKKAGHSLSDEQADYQTRHMSAVSLFYSVAPNESEVDLATMKMDSTYQDAILALRRTQRGK